MSSFVYTPAKAKLPKGELDLDAQDIRVLLVMSNTTADTEQDVATISGFTTLDEYDGANYVRKALTGEVVNQDDPNNRGEFDADDVVWAALGAGTRQCVGMILYRHVTNDTDSVPIAYLDNAPELPFTGNGSDVTATFNVEGILQVT